MKEKLLFLTFLSLSTTISAKEMLHVEGGNFVAFSAYTTSSGSANPFKNVTPSPQMANGQQSESNMKFANLEKLNEQQQLLYNEKIAYLQDELKKSKERLIEKSINTQKIQNNIEKRYAEETTYLKKELVAKTKSLMEYQRQLEKVNLSDEMKSIIKANTELAVELRRSNDQLALVQLKSREAIANNTAPIQITAGRMPASVQEK